VDPTMLDDNDSKRVSDNHIPSSLSDSEDSTASGHNQASASSATRLTSELGSEERHD